MCIRAYLVVSDARASVFFIFAAICVCFCVSLYACICVCVFVGVYVCMSVRVYLCM